LCVEAKHVRSWFLEANRRFPFRSDRFLALNLQKTAPAGQSFRRRIGGGIQVVPSQHHNAKRVSRPAAKSNLIHPATRRIHLGRKRLIAVNGAFGFRFTSVSIGALRIAPYQTDQRVATRTGVGPLAQNFFTHHCTRLAATSLGGRRLSPLEPKIRRRQKLCGRFIPIGSGIRPGQLETQCQFN
jgi:hypothetical protein